MRAGLASMLAVSLCMALAAQARPLAGNHASEHLAGPGNEPAAPAGWTGGGETCAEATIIVSIPYTDRGTTFGHANDYDYACPFSSSSPDVVYALTPSADTEVDLTLCRDYTDYDTKMFVYANDCMSTPIACSEDECSSPLYGSFVSALWSVSLTAGTDYFIVIDGYGGDSGNYQLDIDETPPPPECPPDTTLYGQTPHGPDDDWKAFTSEQTPMLTVFESYSVSADIAGVHWWGLDLLFDGGDWLECDLDDPTAFRIEFYADGGGHPVGDPVCSYDAVDVSVPEGDFFGGYVLKYFQVELDPCCSLRDGWIAIQSDSATSCWFQWMSSGAGDGQAYQYDGIALSPLAYDFAFCLIGAESPCHSLLRGDANCDGRVDGFDIDAFVCALSPGCDYAAQYPGCDMLCAVDCDCDGLVTGFDIDPFVICVMQGGCPPCPCSS